MSQQGQPASIERVYTLTNAAAGNAVAVFTRERVGSLLPLTSPPGTRAPDGSVRPIPSFSTDGLGSSAPLISQSLLTLSDDGQFLFAANPGSNEVSSFLVTVGGLQLVNNVPSGGVLPVSVTSFGALVYVANAVNNLVGNPGADGVGSATIAGFSIETNGRLMPLEDSERELTSLPSPPFTSVPAQIAFNSDGSLLIVSEFLANRITVFQVEEDGRPGKRTENPSAGQRPFGFSFNSRGHLIVSEFGTGSNNDSSVSSYEVSPSGEISVVSAAVPTQQNAACWIANTPDARYSYATNTISGSITGFRVKESGELIPLDTDGVTAVTGDTSTPIDMVISADGTYLDVLCAGTQIIMTFRIADDGSLTPIAGVGNLPPVTTGLAIG